jgi:hypothetical protein
VNFKQMRDQVVQSIGLQDIEDYDETAFVSDLLYRGTIDLLARTRCTVRCLHLRVKADIDTYALDRDVLALVDLDDGRQRRTQRSDHWTVPGFSLIRSDILRVQPVPSEDGEIDCWAVLRPEQMADDDDSPGQDKFGGIPDEYHDAILYYALWQAADYADDQSAGQGERYRITYEGQNGLGGRIALIKMLVNKRGTARAPGRRVRLRGIASREAWVG